MSDVQLSSSGGAVPRMQPLVALRALKLLIADPQRTEEVFVIIRALAGNSMDRGLARFRLLPIGRRVLARREVLLDTLMNRDALSAYPAGSLAEAYLRFTREGNITADGLVEASAPDADGGGELFESEEHKLYGERLRDQHDLWHTLVGYGRDELGEVCLLAFTYAQTRNRGIGVMALVGSFKLSEYFGRGVFAAVWRAYRDGRQAAWLPGQDWQALLGQPLEGLRAELHIRSPERYCRLRTAVALPA